ncbi:hypothetical protein [Paraburkholderia sp. BCC1886]|uniref:hypothetical protein n=1 Tax=Paraburkholderia sp. BCC1886 TaxID=2562670 RepID=UPI001183EE70|nr:hypothetical protein [Paraburkholderia sp. BCC1886]
MKITDKNHIDLRDSMYPTEAFLLDERRPSIDIKARGATVYGYVLSKSGKKTGDVAAQLLHEWAGNPNGMSRTLFAGEAFSFPIKGSVERDPFISIFDDDLEDVAVMLVVRYGFLGQQNFGVAVEAKGRLSYIDGCSDSLLIYPPRLGDPSLNHLHFPPGILQSVHIHPSFRVGMVVSGSGLASTFEDGRETTAALQPGMLWYIEEMEQHRFITETSQMDVLAFHPDGDWGPEDHNHTMLNRTYLKKGA